MKRLRDILKEAAPRIPSKENKQIDNTVSDFARGAYNSATMDLGKYVKAGIDYTVKNVGSKLGVSQPTTYEKELKQEKEKDTIAQTRSPDAYKYGGYTADAVSAASGLGGLAKVGIKQAVKHGPKLIGTSGEKLLGKETGERLLGAKVSGWLKKDQDLMGKSRESLQGEIKDFFPDNAVGNKRLETAIGSDKSKHGTWGLTQHMEKEPQFQQRVINQLKKNDPTDKRIDFLQDRKNVNDWLRKNKPEQFDDIRNPGKMYDDKIKGYRARTDTDAKPGFDPIKNDKGEITGNKIDSAAKARARLKPGRPDADPNLRQAIVSTRAKTQPSFSNRWDDVKPKDFIDTKLDKFANRDSALKVSGQIATGAPALVPNNDWFLQDAKGRTYNYPSKK